MRPVRHGIQEVGLAVKGNLSNISRHTIDDLIGSDKISSPTSFAPFFLETNTDLLVAGAIII